MTHHIIFFFFILLFISVKGVFYASSSTGGDIYPNGITNAKEYSIFAHDGYIFSHLLVDGIPQIVENNTFILRTHNSDSTITALFEPINDQVRASWGQTVSILYETWFSAINAHGFVNIYPQDVPQNTYRYWGEPMSGRYLSNDTTVINRHADLLAAAQMDFIIIDYSNGNILHPEYHQPTFVLLDVFQDRIRRKIPTPKITFLISVDEKQIAKLYSEVYSKYDTALFYYLGPKPLLLPIKSCIYQGCELFTIKEMWGLLPPTDQRWSFLQLYPQKISNVHEQIAVSAAQQETYMSLPTARGRKWDYRTKQQSGVEFRNFDDQWERAISNNVRFVTIKSWNEWVSLNLAGGYTDEFSPEFSNDIEPMKGGFGDLYYNRMKYWIKYFKSL